jgi:hypothetical protein
MSSMTTPAESITGTGTAPAKRKPNKRRAHVQIDKRYALGRRYRALEQMFRQRLGTVAVADPVVVAAIERAARLVALAEDAAAKALNADPRISLDDLVRLERCAAAAVRRLHLERYTPQPPGPTLSEILRRAPPS